ncbi:hypothetical protein M3Y94_00680400 [Aphelenchoides besseyi]|nr:hypothetical protein M3Y94_00680400 [Aphelenchoides besseyi]KAI6231428.1 hypothetical protein M3Y95_00380700 [Aphelenchoides besseyi]
MIRFCLVLLFASLVAAQPRQNRISAYRTAFFPQDHAAGFAAAFESRRAQRQEENPLDYFAEPDPRIVDKRTVAVGRPNFRPGFQDAELADYFMAKRSIALGRQNFRPAKRSVATGRTGFRPAKRFLTL